MIFLKKSLLTISILVVAIWVIPAISNNLKKIREICAKILTDYCNFQEKNNQEKFFNNLTLNKFMSEEVQYHIKCFKKDITEDEDYYLISDEDVDEKDITEDEDYYLISDEDVDGLTEYEDEDVDGLTEYEDEDDDFLIRDDDLTGNEDEDELIDMFNKKILRLTEYVNMFQNIYNNLIKMFNENISKDELINLMQNLDLTEDELNNFKENEPERKKLQVHYNKLINKLNKKISNLQITIKMLQKVKEDGGPLNYILILLENFATKYIQYQQNSINDLTLTSNNTPMMFCEQHIKNDDEIEKFWTDFFFDIPNSN